MDRYRPPLEDIGFCLEEFADLPGLIALPAFSHLAPDLVGSILETAGRFAAERLAPLNGIGDRQGSRLENGVVRTPEGFQKAYEEFRAGGWTGLPFASEFGGQGLPWSLPAAVQEMWGGANLSLALCPPLSQGAAELLAVHGSPAQRKTFLVPLVEGRWTGPMNLTEPQAGSDLGALACRAERAGD